MFALTVQHVVIAVIALIVAAYLLTGLTVVNEWERKPVLRFGKYLRTLGAGVRWIEPFTNKVLPAVSIQDMVTQLVIENIQTHDNIPVAFALLLTYRVIHTAERDGVRDWTLNLGSGNALQQKVIAVVSEVASATELDEILHDRTKLYGDIVSRLQERVQRWGYSIIAVEIKDVKIADESISEAISLKARAVKEGEAELAKANKQEEIAQALDRAAKCYTPEAKWLKGIETLLELGRSGDNNTIIMPTEMVNGLALNPFVGQHK